MLPVGIEREPRRFSKTSWKTKAHGGSEGRVEGRDLAKGVNGEGGAVIGLGGVMSSWKPTRV